MIEKIKSYWQIGLFLIAAVIIISRFWAVPEKLDTISNDLESVDRRLIKVETAVTIHHGQLNLNSISDDNETCREDGDNPVRFAFLKE